VKYEPAMLKWMFGLSRKFLPVRPHVPNLHLNNVRQGLGLRRNNFPFCRRKYRISYL